MKIAAGKRNKKGFTLVELVIVIAVLAILTVIAVPNVSNVINSANENTDKSNAQTIELALKSAYAEAIGGTWDLTGVATPTPTPADITVDEALAHEGLGSISAMTDRIKGNSTHKFVYDANGHISCATPTTKDPVLSALLTDTKVATAINIH